MLTRLKMGWDITVHHKFIVVLLFLYRLLWGFFLYRFIDSLVSPILSRYPVGHPNPHAARLFLIEAQFRIFKTNLLNETLYAIGGLLLLRMLFTPFWNAGVYYSFSQESRDHGTHVWQGIKKHWKSVTLFYWLKNFLLVLPAIWIFPIAKQNFLSFITIPQWTQEMLPYVAFWVGYGLIIHLLTEFMQFAVVTKQSFIKSFHLFITRGISLFAVTFIFIGLGCLLSVAAWSIALFLSGFIVILLHQAIYFIRSLLLIWTAASQYSVWAYKK